MDFHYSNFIDELQPEETDQIRSIAKKTWLSTASSSLANLEKVQTNVYNVGLADPRDLKATNLRTRRKAPPGSGNSELETDRSSIQSGTVKAWGSNSSIPDAVNLYGNNVLQKPLRPASAKLSTNRVRPPSGRKPRPQSAKEPLPGGTVSEQIFGVKGAKYDPNGRPPKGVSHTSSVGWVGPPAGLKYPDRPPDGVPWQMDLPVEDENIQEEMGMANYRTDTPEAPPPPYTSPAPSSPEPEERTKRVFELFIGDPYKVSEDADLIESSDEEYLFEPPSPKGYTQPYVNHTDSHTPEDVNHYENRTPKDDNYYENCTPKDVNHYVSHTPEKESLRLSLPVADDDYDEADDVDTERLLAEAESVSKKLNLKSIISSNKNLPVSTLETDSTHDSQLTNQISQSVNVTEAPINKISDNLNTKQRAEELVSEIITENGLDFVKKDKSNKKNMLERDKSGVKFNEDVTTVNITPRNIGRKVEELHHKKKTVHHTTDNFVDLIEIKNRVEPVLSTGKAEFAQREIRSPPRAPNRPPSGKFMATDNSKGSKQSSLQNKMKMNSPYAPTTKVKHDHEQSAPSYNRTHSNTARPRSASGPLNRVARPITTVTVDYGEVERAEKEKAKNEANKKKEKRRKDDVVTMMQKIDLDEVEGQGQIHRTISQGGLDGKLEGDKSGITHESIISAPTVFKSGHEKNYYEISRHSSMSNVGDAETKPEPVRPVSIENTVYKTTKTLEFDEVEPKEVTIKSIIDPHMVSTKEKDRFLATSPDIKHRKPQSRPSSAKLPVSKQMKSEDDLERPGSRLGFVAMSPDESSTDKSKTMNRPTSAPSYRRPRSAVKDKENKTQMKTKKAEAEKKDLTETEKEEREKVIDNLLERTKSLAENQEEPSEGTDDTSMTGKPQKEKRKPRPFSAHVGLLSRNKEVTAKTGLNKRPMSATSSAHEHYASYSRTSSAGSSKSKKSSSKTRVVLTEPCIINTNTSFFEEEETEEDIACQKMEQELAEKGLHISAATLQRALYPPSGKSRYYQITADLPQKSSLSLLSHPKVWLPEEHKRLVKAEKTLEKANEMMFLQEKAEKRRAFLASLTPEQRKKLKKKGKKGKKGGKKIHKKHSAV